VMGPEDGSGDIANSTTLSLTMTEAGLIIGTAAYMAPEQAKGKSVDRRADIWAFGSLLYEMLSGQKGFEGETVSDILAAVILKDPDWSVLAETTPAPVQKLIRRCLAKDSKQRLRDIARCTDHD
jgi:eukaryotic-like serine/threonine-protein kinase